MQNTKDIMKKIISTTDICLNGEIISREVLLTNFGEFITDNCVREEHSVGVAMHTGSICFDVIAVTYAAIWCLLYNETNSEELIQSLENDDMVLYGKGKKERYVFKGFIDGKELSSDYSGKEFIKLSQDSGAITYVPRVSWQYIEPYKGNAKKADGRGIRKKTNIRELFFTNVLGYDSANVPAVIDTSCVLVMARDKADNLIKGISIRFAENEISLLDLVTASYFTEEDEYMYGGNVSKNEPIIKITSKISVARTLLYSRRGNYHLGVFILDKDIISRGYSELPEIMNRKSLGFVFACMPVDIESATMLLNEYEAGEIFACTKQYLQDWKWTQEADNPYINELKEQVNAIRNRENIIEVVQGSPITMGDYKEIRRRLLLIKRDEYNSQEKEHFIVHAFSLLNYILTATFTINEFERESISGTFDVETPIQKLKRISEYVKTFPNRLQELAEEIIQVITDAVDSIMDINTKREWILNYLWEHRDCDIAIVVPKAYYVPIIQNIILKGFGNRVKVNVLTMGKYAPGKIYDILIAVGDIEAKSFNVFQCNSARVVISLLYDVEKNKCVYKMGVAQRKEKIINSKANHIIVEDEPSVNTVIESEIENDEEINSYITHLNLLFNTYQAATSGYKASANADVIATAVFSDDTKAFLSKRYKGYVLDESNGLVKEKNADELHEGDALIFTKNTNETQDIVDSILEQLISEQKLNDSISIAYYESKRWKSALADYMKQHELTERQVAAKMLKSGVPVQEATLIIWMDEAAHTVGPRKMESIIFIADFVGDEQLKIDANSIFEACREIRHIRRKILEQIGNAIVDKLSGREMSAENEFSIIYERVDTMAEVKHIERLSFIEQSVPINFINRPLHV